MTANSQVFALVDIMQGECFWVIIPLNLNKKFGWIQSIDCVPYLLLCIIIVGSIISMLLQRLSHTMVQSLMVQ